MAWHGMAWHGMAWHDVVHERTLQERKAATLVCSCCVTLVTKASYLPSTI